MLTEHGADGRARAAKGFMPDDEGLALHDAGTRRRRASARCSRSAPTAGSRASTSARRRARPAPCCSRSTTTAARRRTRPAGSTTTPRSSIRATGRMDTLPFFRRTIDDAGLEDVVVGVLGDSPTVGRHWTTPLGFLFIDGGHAEDVAMADYATWARHVLARRRARDPRRLRGPGRRRSGAVPRLAARRRRRLHAGRDDGFAPHPPPLSPSTANRHAECTPGCDTGAVREGASGGCGRARSRRRPGGAPRR